MEIYFQKLETFKNISKYTYSSRFLCLKFQTQNESITQCHSKNKTVS